MQKDKTNTRLRELEKLVRSQQDKLFAIAYVRLGNRADAEDILQDVFLKLFRSEENLRHVNNLEHYLIRCVCNRCRDCQRARQYNMLPIGDAVQIPIPEAILPSYPLKQLEAKGLKGCVLIRKGESFKSGTYGGLFIPCEIQLADGKKIKRKLALRNDNQWRTWEVDGGI